MKNTTATKTDYLNDMKAKVRVLEMLPREDTIYESALEYGKKERWSFDEDKFNIDDEYRESVEYDFNDYINRATAFNAWLTKIAQFVANN